MESTREEVKLGSREARQRHCCGTSLLKCSEVVSWLTEDDKRYPGRQVERGKRLRHALRRIERTSHPRPDARDVVNTINYERDSAIGLRLQRAAESGDKSVLVRREARTLVVDEPRVLRCETIEKA